MAPALEEWKEKIVFRVVRSLYIEKKDLRVENKLDSFDRPRNILIWYIFFGTPTN